MKEKDNDIAKRMKARMEQQKRTVNQFFKQMYPQLSIDDKAAYWASNLRTEMCRNGESGVNPLQALSKATYTDMKEIDADIDKLLPIIAQLLKIEIGKLNTALKS